MFCLSWPNEAVILYNPYLLEFASFANGFGLDDVSSWIPHSSTSKVQKLPLPPLIFPYSTHKATFALLASSRALASYHPLAYNPC